MRVISCRFAVAPPRSHFYRILNLNVTVQGTRHLVEGTLEPIVGVFVHIPHLSLHVKKAIREAIAQIPPLRVHRHTQRECP